MSRRIEVELTSARDDGTWTWRAAGAREPRGVLDGALLPAGAKAGDVLRVEADFDLDGVTITGLAPVTEKHRNEAQRIEIIGRPQRDDELVTSTLVPKGKGDRPGRGPRRDRDDRPSRGDRNERGGPGAPGDRGPRRDGDRRPRTDGDRPAGAPRGDRRPPRPPRVEEPARPKPKRLRPKRVHRSALLDELPVEHRPIAEQVMQGDVPAVRQAIDKENEARAGRGEAPIAGTEIIAIAEKLRPRVRTAEWHDRADAAMADIDELDLRDLRSVVVAADGAARDDETRALAAELREALARRVEAEQAAWVAELAESLDDGRVVRALRLSSRPPKAGALLRPELSARLAEAASASLTELVTPDRWAVLLDAIAHSPVRLMVKPLSLPPTPGDELLAVVTKLSSRIPEIAAQFGVEVVEAPKARGPRRPPRPPKPPKPAKPSAQPAEAVAEPTKPAASAEPVEQAASAEPVEPAASAEPVEHVEQVAGAVEDDVAADGDGPGVPEGDGEPAPDVEGAAPVVVGVADEEHVAPADPEPVEDGAEALGSVEAVGEEGDDGPPAETLELDSP